MNVERSLSNAIAALTAIAGALATVAGFVPEQWVEAVLAVSTGAALLAGNLREWRETFFASALVAAAGVGAAVGVTACGPRVAELAADRLRQREGGARVYLHRSGFGRVCRGARCEGDIEGVGSLKVEASGVLEINDRSWPMSGDATGYARASEDGAELGASVCIDSELFDDVNKLLGLVDALHPGSTVPRIRRRYAPKPDSPTVSAVSAASDAASASRSAANASRPSAGGWSRTSPRL